MKCIILAAGYATRLYPLTENYPKPLLDVQGKKILDYLIDDIETSSLIDQYIIVSNHKFYDTFLKWSFERGENIQVIDDGSTSNDTRLGAVKDILFAINHFKIDEDCLVIAGDNLLDFSISLFLDYCLHKKTSCVMRCYEEKISELRKTGVLELDENDKILDFEEKPEHPKTHYACPPFYFFTKKDLKKIEEAILDGCQVDAPGSLITWLCKKTDIHAFLMPGNRYDIGTLESYEYIKTNYKGVR